MFKLLALLFMTIDHIGVYFQPVLDESTYMILRMIGRLAFPMFAYSIVKGIYFTKNVYRYLGRLLGFALLTQIAISTTSYFTGQYANINVLFTFTLGALFCISLDALGKNDILCGPVIAKWLEHYPQWRKPLCLLSIILIHFITFFLQPDYDIYGLYTIYIYKQIFDLHPEVWGPAATQAKNLRALVPVLMSFLIFNLIYFVLEWPLIFPFSKFSIYALTQHLSILHILFLPLDRRTKKPSKFYQYSFYFYYPAHICFLMLLTQCII